MPTATQSKERKHITFLLKASNDEQGIIEGYASIFGNEDSYKDVVVPGAYRKTITDAKSSKRQYLYPLLYQHDPNVVIGGVIDAREDTSGLYFKAKINMDTQAGRETYSNIKAGFIDGISIGYDALDKEYKDGVRYLKQIRLWEVSAVTFPANAEAVVTGVKKLSRNTRAMQKKDFPDHYREEMIEDWMGPDFNNLVCALKCSLLDMFSIGDQPMSDVETTVLNDGANGPGFISAVKEYVQRGIDLGVANYISAMNNDQDDMPMSGYMSAENRRSSKAGAMFSQTNKEVIQKHVDSLRASLRAKKSADRQHYQDIDNTANDLENILGSAPYDPMPKSRPFVQTPVRDETNQPAETTDLETFSRKAEEIQRLLKKAK